MKKLGNMRLTPSRKSLALMIYCIATTMIPNFILDFTENYNGWSIAAGILLPLGFYITFCSMIRRTGLQILLMIVFMFLSAFQIVLLYLFGNSIIATDMFVNLLTTNPNEATELLANIAPSVIFVFAIYLPIIIYGAFIFHRKYHITKKMRRNSLLVGIPTMLLGALLLHPAAEHNNDKPVFLDEIFPVNVIYNAQLGIRVHLAMLNYEKSSDGFTFNAERTDVPKQREIYVYMIGEAARAADWSLYGYGRETNPCLSKRSDIYPFRNVLTQSNTTHKSVPMFLTSAWAGNHSEMYSRKGLPQLFREAGFKTYFISNQNPQGAMVDKLGCQADEVVYIGAPRYDMQLLHMMDRIIASSTEQKMFFILHCYGSHFSYHQRYPETESFFTPDEDVSISAQNVPLLTNSYDNSIRYADKVLNSIIEYLNAQNACSALLYCSDHGEDLFDDSRNRFLHASPTVTYYQLHIPSLAWFSKQYRDRYPEHVKAAADNAYAPATTHSMFHTIADIASIYCQYIDQSVSLVNPEFDYEAPRYYLDDHNKAAHFDPFIGLTDEDYRLFREHGINSL